MTTADELIESAIAHERDGEAAEAARAFTEAFALAPTDSRLPWEAGRLYLYHLPQPAEAVRWFEASLPLLDDAARATDTRYHLGLAHVFQEDDARARVRFEEVLAQVPTHVLACIELGKLCTRSGEHARAADLLQQAVLHNKMRATMPEMFPDGQRGSAHAEALAWLNLARLTLVVLDGEGEHEAMGANAIGRLIDDLRDWQRARMVAREARAAGKITGAIIAVEQMLARDPDDEEATRLWFELVLDDMEQLETVLDMAREMLEADLARAARMIDEVLARDPANVDALAMRAGMKAPES